MQKQDLDDVLARTGGMSADQIKEVIAALKVQAAEARRAATAKAKKEEAKRLILRGRLLDHLVQQGKIDADMIAQALDGYLDNNKDRALFGLPALPEEKAAKRGRGRPKKTEVIEAEGTVTDADEQPDDQVADQDASVPDAGGAQDNEPDQDEKPAGWKKLFG